MSTATKTLYETDFVEWADHTAELLRQGKFDEVDLEHLIEEVEGLAGSDRDAVVSQLRRMLPLIKERIQPERAGSSWRSVVIDAQREIELYLEASPSLRRHLEGALQKKLPDRRKGCPRGDGPYGESEGVFASGKAPV